MRDIRACKLSKIYVYARHARIVQARALYIIKLQNHMRDMRACKLF